MGQEFSPFAAFYSTIRPQSDLRHRITAAYRRPEPDCVADLIEAADVGDAVRRDIAATATTLVRGIRKKGRRGGVEGLVKEYSLSSDEGVALMCLAEALLRIPDNATRDALIRDKIAGGDWRAHLGQGRSLFVNAATWGLAITGKLVGSVNEQGFSAALTRLIARGGEPLIRRGVDIAMQMMGEQFVTGQTIEEALERSQKLEAQGFSYSYDMLGEAATTAADAQRYYADYERAIHAIGRAANNQGIYTSPGISIKLSALHPRYSRAQAGRVMTELMPRVRELALLAKGHNIGLNIDAEEADRLGLSLDLLEDLALDPALVGWNGLGFVLQAYGKRCPFVLDWLIDLAERADRRIMVRLVKGAYWDSEIKRAQVDGLADFPVYTRKVHTDVAYLACARKLLAARHAIFPQFATHNAQTVAAIYHLAGPDFHLGDYEFQCLHGMGEALYEEVVGSGKLDRPCRIYAPVGTHETLLAYLVRRLLENGANASFVHRISDETVSVEELTQDPVIEARAIAPLGAPHPLVALPKAIYGQRLNSSGIDLSDESALRSLSAALLESTKIDWNAASSEDRGAAIPVLNPGDHCDRVGTVVPAGEAAVAASMAEAVEAFASWAATDVFERAACLDRAADVFQDRMPVLLGLIVREAGKSVPNAIGEVRETIDFLRYYASEARRTLTAANAPLGAIACISPWNFPLAIFTGQVVAALVTGNTVLAKPAEETPLIAAECVRILHEAGVPKAVLQLMPGDGTVGAALVARPETAAVIFTGSTEVAKLIQRELAGRVSAEGAPIPLIAETGGQNAMIVDSSALAEQVVADVMASAFDSAGQRCSALRVLCLQDDIAEHQLTMLKGALAELSIGRTDRLSCDVGPVISAEAQGTINDHIGRMRAMGCRVEQLPLPDEAQHGTFVAPTIIELKSIGQLSREVFGPVLHVVRYKREALEALVDQINATGYGLTFGLHTRLDETVARVTQRARAGNIYVNRNIIGAVVGVQPFGGCGLSGTGPKAGGPLYLGRLVQTAPSVVMTGKANGDPAWSSLLSWLPEPRAATATRNRSLAGHMVELPGPVGELNLYGIHSRGRVLLLPSSRQGLIDQVTSALAVGNRCVIKAGPELRDMVRDFPQQLAREIEWVDDPASAGPYAAVLVEPGSGDPVPILRGIAELEGPIPLVQTPAPDGSYRLDWLVEEVSTSINTTAAGGNASLMALV